METEIMVSICCLTFNHEKYIRNALDGFVNQKTNFKYEILIHDDCSTDNTPTIIKEYEKRYPKLIKPIYQNVNQFSKGIHISSTYQFPRAKGKYIAMCEGDDYWTDCNKLQLQFDAMEKNKNCTLCTHIVQHIDETGNYVDNTQPNQEIKNKINEGVIPNKIFFNKVFFDMIIPFQTSSFFLKKEDVIKYSNTFLKEIDKIKDFGDVPLSWYMLLNGDCYFINKVMSNYRENSIGSWSNNLKNKNLIIKHYNDIIYFFNKFNSFSKYKFNDSISYLVRKYEFRILVEKDDFSKMVDFKYKKFFRELALEYRIKIYVYAYIPFIRKIRNKIKSK